MRIPALYKDMTISIPYGITTTTSTVAVFKLYTTTATTLTAYYGRSLVYDDSNTITNSSVSSMVITQIIGINN
jgi:hypothetical protein